MPKSRGQAARFQHLEVKFRPQQFFGAEELP